MRIGLIAPPWVPVPPPAYGGTEVVIDNLARGLQELGHEVRLFTVGESQCPVPTDFLYPKAIAPIGVTVPETAHVLAAYESLADMDVIHDHTFLGPLISGLRGMRRPPVVHTNHGPFNGETQPVLTRRSPGTRRIVAISHSQARQAQEYGGGQIAGVIHHGIDLDVYTAGQGGGGYVMFIGRMSPDKGVHHAVRIAKKAGKRLVLSHQDARGQRDRLLRGRDQAAARSWRRDAVGDPAGTQDRAAARRRRDAQPDYLARALRPGDGGGTGVRHAGACLPERSRSGDH